MKWAILKLIIYGLNIKYCWLFTKSCLAANLILVYVYIDILNKRYTQGNSRRGTPPPHTPSGSEKIKKKIMRVAQREKKVRREMLYYM